MLRKLSLINADEYAVSVVTNKVAEMVVKFGLGKQHSISIGSEQGDISAWDDIVIQECDFQKHFQIKRQNTNFGNESCEKNQIISSDGTFKERELSALDKTLKELADWTKGKNLETITPKRKFEIVLPTATINIKKDLSVNILKNLCENHIKDVTIVSGLESLQANDTTIDRCYKWLNTWCDFENWDHILKSLKLLKISANNGSKEDVDLATKNILSQLYNNTDEVFIKLKDYVTNNTTFTGAITPRPLFHLLKSYLLPGISLWSQFEKNGTEWLISGTHDTVSNLDKERPSILVPALWDNKTESSLKIVVPENTNSKLLNRVLHLALHLEGLSNAHIYNLANWEEKLKNKLGHTIGTNNSDCSNLNIKNNVSNYSTSDIKPFKTLTEQETLADEIYNEIIKTTWIKVCDKINAKIEETAVSSLRDAIEERWKVWQDELKIDIEQQKLLLKAMLHPVSEGEDIEGELRIGIKTIDLIVEGIMLLLAVSSALSTEHKSWCRIKEYSATTIGLAYWSGPSGKTRKVQDIEDGVNEIIGTTKTDILILSKVKDPTTQILNSTLASGKTTVNDLAQQHKPKLIITNHKAFRDLINKGNLNELTKYLEKTISQNELAQKTTIQNLSK